jgi:hypothetical protein
MMDIVVALTAEEGGLVGKVLVASKFVVGPRLASNQSNINSLGTTCALPLVKMVLSSF